jgi:uncharacterized protein DUF3883
MAKEHKFVTSIDELIDSAIEFYSKPEFYKEVLRSSPKYFVHIKINNKHLFGLSKFCAFKNISVEEYITTYRYREDGGTTQKYIARVTGQKWIERKKIDTEIKNAFDNWISKFFPNYSVDSALFITLPSEGVTKRESIKFITPKDLLENLKLQEEIGKVGERIALAFEIQRLKELGVKDPDTRVEHVATINPAAGYDIYSSAKEETRYIEVKSSLNNNEEFFITENELQTLSTLGDKAFLYLVYITDLSKKFGQVFKVHKDPIKLLKENGILKPIAYKAKIKN